MVSLQFVQRMGDDKAVILSKQQWEENPLKLLDLTLRYVHNILNQQDRLI